MSLYSISASAGDYPNGDLTSIINGATTGEVINLTGTSYTYTVKASTLTKSLTIQASPSLSVRPVITCGQAGVQFVATGATSQTLTLRGLEFNGNALATGLTQGKNAAGGNFTVTIDNCKTSNFATGTSMFTYSTVSGLSVYGNLTVKNSQFIGPYPSSLLATTTTYTSPNNISFSNCLIKGINPASITLIKVTASTPLNSITIDHCTFQNGVSGTVAASKILNLPAGTPQIVKNCIFVDQPATYANAIAANASNDKNVMYNCGGVLATRWANFGTPLTTNPSLNTYNYTTESTYMAGATDGKAIGYSPRLKMTVSSAGDVTSISGNTTLQMTAAVTDSLSAFSPAVTWSTNATNGSTISSTGLFTAGATSQAGIVITATTAYGYVATKTIDVTSAYTVIVTSAGNLNSISANTTLQMSAIATDSINTVTPEVTWSTNATNGSTISSTGLFTAGSVSQAGIVITATAAGYGAGTKTIAVTPAFRVVVSSAGNLNSIPLKGTLQMTAVLTDSLTITSIPVTWSINAAHGSTINTAGLFTAGQIIESGIVVTATTANGVEAKTMNVIAAHPNDSLTKEIMSVQNNTGSLTTDSLKNIHKISFSGGQIVINKETGSPSSYAIGSIRYVNILDPNATIPVSNPNWNLILSPNPIVDLLSIQLLMEGTQPIVLEILSLDGKNIYYTGSIDGQGAASQINIATLPAGTYICKASNGTIIEATQFVKI